MQKSHSNADTHFGVLDGLRGFLSLWVFWGNLQFASIGSPPPVLGEPALAVDLFMLLSGFLMMYHWSARAQQFESPLQQTRDFWIRRFFRIAPVYYLCLSVALIFQSQLFAARWHVAHTVPPPWAKDAATFQSPNNPDVTLTNVLSHFSFLFGFFPQYASNNALPDWSIGLEMQFYMALPFLVALASRFGVISFACGALFLHGVTNRMFGLYLTNGPFGNFPQPSMLGFKIHIFAAGMLLAEAYSAFTKRDQRDTLILLALFAVLLRREDYIVVAVSFVLTLILFQDVHKQDFVARLASSRFGRFLGDTSYSVYLIHCLVMFPLLSALLSQPWFIAITGVRRTICAFGLIAPLVYLIAWLLFIYVEVPGIRAGRAFSKWVSSSRSRMDETTLVSS